MTGNTADLLRFVVGVIAVAPMLAPAPAQNTAPKTGTVQGVVRAEGPDGAPLADLSVAIGKLSTVTGSDGRYELRDVLPGRQDVSLGQSFRGPVGRTSKPVSVVAGKPPQSTLQCLCLG